MASKGPSKADLLRQYERYHGTTASPRATKVWLTSQVDAAKSAAGANRRSAAIQAAALITTAVGTYRRERAEQAVNPDKRSYGGDVTDRLKAGLSAAYAVAPGAALTAVQGSANAMAHGYHHFSLGLALPKVISTPAAAVTKVTGRAVLPALAAWQMHAGAKEDQESALRGAGRGLVRAIDVTGIVMGKGVLERGYDAVAGVPKAPPTPGFFDNRHDPKFKRQPNQYEQFIDRMKDRAKMSVLGGTYTRTYATGPKAGTTETVTRT